LDTTSAATGYEAAIGFDKVLNSGSSNVEGQNRQSGRDAG
jgi:hypothetical protein